MSWIWHKNIWWWGSRPRSLVNVVYPFIALTPQGLLWPGVVVPIWAPSIGKIGTVYQYWNKLDCRNGNHLTVCKQMSFGLFENVTNKLKNHIYQQDLALNNHLGLICQETKWPNLTSPSTRSRHNKCKCPFHEIISRRYFSKCPTQNKQLYNVLKDFLLESAIRHIFSVTRI